MKVTQESVVFERAHEALVRGHSIHMNPDALQTLVETVLEDRVTASHADRRYRQGVEANDAQYQALVKARVALEQTRDLVSRCLAWTGPDHLQTEAIESLDSLLADLQSVTQSVTTP